MFQIPLVKNERINLKYNFQLEYLSAETTTLIYAFSITL